MNAELPEWIRDIELNCRYRWYDADDVIDRSTVRALLKAFMIAHKTLVAMTEEAAKTNNVKMHAIGLVALDRFTQGALAVCDEGEIPYEV